VPSIWTTPNRLVWAADPVSARDRQRIRDVRCIEAEKPDDGADPQRLEAQVTA